MRSILFSKKLFASPGSVYFMLCAFVVTLPSARCGPIFYPASSAGCNSGSPDGFSGVAQTTSFAAINGIQGISLSGDCSAFFSAGTIGDGSDLFAFMSGGSGGSDAFETDSIHITWNFTPGSDVFGGVDWLVWLTVNGSTTQFGGTVDPGLPVIGEGDVSIPQGNTLDSWEAGIAFSQNDRLDFDTNLSLTIPAQSLDIGSPMSDVPEPVPAFVVLLAFTLLECGYFLRYGRQPWVKQNRR